MVNLAEHPVLVVRQEVGHIEAFMGFETENRYIVATPDGDKLLYAAEECSFLGRNFLKSHRPLTLKAADAQGRVAFEASRNFFWFFSHLHVSDSAWPLGSLRRQFGVLVRKFTLEDSTGRELAEIRGTPATPQYLYGIQAGL